VQNIGAYGVEVGNVVEWVEVLNTKTMEINKMTNGECLFNYRDSFFKSKKGKKFVILNVVFKLKRKGEFNTHYKDIEEYFVKRNITPSLKTLRTAIIEIRKSKLPDTRKVGTVGSFFKNPIVSKKDVGEVRKKYPNISEYTYVGGFVKLSAAWLIDNIGGWKGACVGDACVYENQALVIINKGRASTKEIIFLANKIKNNIKEKTGVELEFEVNIIGIIK